MTVTIRKYVRRRSSLEPRGWEVDIQVERADGSVRRERRKAPVSLKSAALRWARKRERELALEGPVPQRKEVPTLNEFAPRFLDGYATANRQKPSGIAAKETVLRIHLLPRLGGSALDEITNEDVQLLKSKLRGKRRRRSTMSSRF